MPEARHGCPASRGSIQPSGDSRQCVDSCYQWGVPRFMAFAFVLLHRCCIFYKLEARSATSKKDYLPLCCDTHFFSRGLEPNPQYL